MTFLFTKEKLVFGIALLASLSSFTGIHKPVTEELPKIPPEEGARAPRVTVPVPTLRPEKPLVEGSARDPFVPESAWTAATPARLGALPDPVSPRILPAGTRGALVVVDKEPKAVEEPDPAAPPKEDK